MKLNIKSKDYELNWGIGAIEKTAEIFDLNADNLVTGSVLFEIGNDGEIDLTKPVGVDKRLIFGALLNGCDLFEEKADFTWSQFLNELNEWDEKVHKEIFESYNKSKYLGKTIESIIEKMVAKLTVTEVADEKKSARSKRKS